MGGERGSTDQGRMAFSAEDRKAQGMSRRRKVITWGSILLLWTIVVDILLTARSAHLYGNIQQTIDSFADKVFGELEEFQPIHRKSGSYSVSVSSGRQNKGERVTAILSVGLDKEEITRPLKMPKGYAPTYVSIYDTKQLIGSEGYLVEWDQWGTERLGWQPRWYPRRLSLTVETSKQSYNLWGFGVDGNAYLTNASPAEVSRLAQEFARPLPAFEKLYAVKYTCSQSLKDKVDWAVFEWDALLQIHSYDEEGKYRSSVGIFSDYEKAKNTVLLLWAGNSRYQVSSFKVSVLERPSSK